LEENRTVVRGRRKVVVAATGPATRAGIRLALEAAEVATCVEASSVSDLLAAVDREGPSVCLLDVDLSESPLGVAAKVLARRPSMAVVLLTDEITEAEFLGAVRAGAVGYLHKGVSPEALSNVVRGVSRGESAFPRSLVFALIDGHRQRSVRLADVSGVELTSREWEVLEFMREGLTTRQIADRLLISEVTVRRHISSVLKKLKVPSRTDAVKLLRSA
jgi:two-component system, NarL family, nitrate/nitrite response regulator NarL